MKNMSINTEDFLFIILIVSTVINIIGNSFTKKGNHFKADNYYLVSLIVTIIVYFYFFYTNYNLYIKCNKNDKRLFQIKLFGNCLLISGALCYIYFVINDPNLNTAPVI